MNAKVITISEARYKELLEKERFVEDVIMDIDEYLERRYGMKNSMLLKEYGIPVDEYVRLVDTWYFREGMISAGIQSWIGYDGALELIETKYLDKIYGDNMVGEEDVVVIFESEYDELLQAERWSESMIESGVEEWAGYLTAKDITHVLKMENTYGE